MQCSNGKLYFDHLVGAQAQAVALRKAAFIRLLADNTPRSKHQK